MTPQELINSGLLELYVAGACTEDERAIVEHHVGLYPEVASELQVIAHVVEQASKELAAKPPATLRVKILEAIEQLPAEADKHKADAPVFQMPQPAKEPIKWSRYLVAASIGLAVGLVPSGITWIQLQQTQTELEQTKDELAQAEQRSTSIAANKVNLERILNQFASADLMRISLASVQPNQQVRADVWWNRSTHAVIIDARSLPELDSHKDYQLWAIEGGVPIDLGLVRKQGDGMMVLEMKPSAAPQMFAITVEPKGGRPTPTLQAMIVAGKVS